MASIYIQTESTFSKPNHSFESVFLKKTNIRLKSVNLQQKIGKRLLLGREQRLVWAAWGSTSTWPLLLAVLGLYLPQLRLSVGRAVVAGTKPCLRSHSGVWKSGNTIKRSDCFSEMHWECHPPFSWKGLRKSPDGGWELSQFWYQKPETTKAWAMLLLNFPPYSCVRFPLHCLFDGMILCFTSLS